MAEANTIRNVIDTLNSIYSKLKEHAKAYAKLYANAYEAQDHGKIDLIRSDYSELCRVARNILEARILLEYSIDVDKRTRSVLVALAVEKIMRIAPDLAYRLLHSIDPSLWGYIRKMYREEDVNLYDKDFPPL